MNKEILIAKYFKEQLSPKEQLEFDNLLINNANFKAEVEEFNNIHNAYKLKERENLKSFLKSIEANQTSKKSFNRFKLISLITAACIIIGAFFFLKKSKKPNDIYASYFEAYPNVIEPIVRGKDNTNTEAFRAYENGDYKKAEVTLNKLLKVETNANLEFYYAMALLNQNKFDEAKIILNNLKSKPQNFLAETYWYSALIYLKKKDITSAKSELKKLKDINSNFKNKETEDILDLLE